MNEFDDLVLACFLKKQSRLFPEKVAETLDEAEAFLEESMAMVVNTVDEVWEYFEEEGLDLNGLTKDELLEAEEVFAVGDGRYLIVQG
ncbi:MAG: glyoxalase [Lachnospiraceae bacterium]|nr:glyoxalase [Lachnospiraceae bacterium]